MAVAVAVTVAVAVSVVVRVGMVMMMVTMVVVVLMLTAQVIVSITRVQNLHLNQVEDEAHDRNNQHDIALHLRRRKEAHGGLPEEPACHDPDCRYGHECTDDLSPMPPVGHVLVRRVLRHCQRKNRDAEAHQVTRQVRRVSENCNGTGQIPAYELGCNEHCGDEGDCDQLLLCRGIALLLHF